MSDRSGYSRGTTFISVNALGLCVSHSFLSFFIHTYLAIVSVRPYTLLLLACRAVQWRQARRDGR